MVKRKDDIELSAALGHIAPKAFSDPSLPLSELCGQLDIEALTTQHKEHTTTETSSEENAPVVKHASEKEHTCTRTLHRTRTRACPSCGTWTRTRTGTYTSSTGIIRETCAATRKKVSKPVNPVKLRVFWTSEDTRELKNIFEEELFHSTADRKRIPKKMMYAKALSSANLALLIQKYGGD